MRPFLTLLLAATTLAGCAVGPNYERPAPPATGVGGFVSTSAAVSTEAPRDDWWRLFADPTLDTLVAQALEANRDLAAAEAGLARVRASLSESRVGLLPTTTTTASAQRVRQVFPGFGQTEGDQYRAGVDVSYEVDLFGRVRRTIEASRADVGAAEAARDAVRLSVAAETARAFADVCAGNAQLAVARRTVSLLEESLSLTQRQLDAGRGTGLDVAQAAAQAESTRSSIPSLEAAREAAVFRLTTLLGVTPSQAPAAARACTSAPRVAGAIPVGDGAALIQRRPDVRQAERQLAAATARVGVATAALYPTITLGGSLSTFSQRTADFGDDFQYSIGPLISWSFPNIFATRARIRQAGASADEALARFEGTTLSALSETETALSNYARELDRRTALTRARDRSAEAARLARMRFEAGRDSFLVVLDAERTLAGLEAQLAQSEAAVTTAQVVLFKALGGAWSQPAA
jgi:NodT family efflux transporter outer membrane factor (OMF) lipoprotein